MLKVLASPALLIFTLFCSLLANAAPPLSAYGALAGIDSPALSPSGKRAAMLTTVNGQRVFAAIELGGKVLLHADIGDLKIRSLEWAGEDYVLILFSTTQNLGPMYGYKHELENILVVDIKSAKHSLPLENSKMANAIFGFYGAYLQGGRWYAHVGAIPLQRSGLDGPGYLSADPPKLVRIDLATGKIERVAEANKDGRGWLLNRSGEIIANERYNDSTKVWTLYAGAHEDRLIAQAEDAFGRNHISGQGRTPGTILYVTYDKNDGGHSMESALDGSSNPVEILKELDINKFVFDADTGLLDGVVKRGNDRQIVMFSAAKAARVDGVREAFPNHNIRFYSASNNFDQLLVQTDGHDDSGTWWLVDIPTGDAAPIGYDYPVIDEKSVNPWRVINYKAADGLALEGILTLPSTVNGTKLPLVVMPHGGPEARDYPLCDWWAQAFASQGYAVWQPNFRGSSGYGVTLRNAGYGEMGRKMQTDISDGVAELARQGLVDPARACIVGASYGGYAALAGVTVQHGLYRCAVSVSGFTDIDTGLFRITNRYRAAELRYWQKYVGTGTNGNKSPDTISPLKLAQQSDAPVLLIHGKDDTIVPIEQSLLMRRALEAAHKPVEMLTLEGEDHWLSRAATRTAMLEASVAFVQRHNPSTATPIAAIPAQK